MITNKKKFLKDVTKLFPEYTDLNAVLDEAEEKLCIGNNQVEFKEFRNSNLVVKLFGFVSLKNGKFRYTGVY